MNASALTACIALLHLLGMFAAMHAVMHTRTPAAARSSSTCCRRRPSASSWMKKNCTSRQCLASAIAASIASKPASPSISRRSRWPPRNGRPCSALIAA
jgi:hypothetical protein